MKWIVIVGLLLLAAVPVKAKDAKTERLWKAKCASCHGVDGKAQTEQGKKMSMHDITTAAWQKSVTDDQIKKTITGGGASVGKSPIMPAQPDLAQKPEVLDGLVKIIRGFGSS